MKIYRALYCPCIHESAYATLSTHKTLEGAVEAVEIHKAAIRKEWEETRDYWCDKYPITYPTYDEYDKKFPFGKFENWKVVDDELLD